ncbi:hypothetical protein HPG69_012693 [Diceros bicornis minor]|uniref:Uncharacterized protein n=1 Tax=Diceros bicornis minor TaxID=77932 RepID=A0A7J7EIB3_DICBM|nr:hypothetical protein HPG69_012693 [Diceros bicornis minor]
MVVRISVHEDGVWGVEAKNWRVPISAEFHFSLSKPVSGPPARTHMKLPQVSVPLVSREAIQKHRGSGFSPDFEGLGHEPQIHLLLLLGALALKETWAGECGVGRKRLLWEAERGDRVAGAQDPRGRRISTAPGTTPPTTSAPPRSDPSCPSAASHPLLSPTRVSHCPLSI